MDIQQLQNFAEVASLGSFAAVAQKQGRDPSVISRSVAGLETELKIQLFKRSTRKVTLTEAGERYLGRIKPVLDELRFAEEDARSLISKPGGKLRITASVAFGQVCLLPHLQGFLERYPDLSLELVLSDENLDLLTDDIDLACRLSPSFDSDMVGVRLFDTRYRVCASPQYLQTSGAIESPCQLADRNCLVFNLPRYRSRWLFKEKSGNLEEVTIKSRLAISGALALKDCAVQGMGPALLADWLTRSHLQDGTLIDLFPDYLVTATDFETAAWLLYPSRKYLPRKTRVLIDYLQSVLT